jgi:hypothetical protein
VDHFCIHSSRHYILGRPFYDITVFRVDAALGAPAHGSTGAGSGLRLAEDVRGRPDGVGYWVFGGSVSVRTPCGNAAHSGSQQLAAVQIGRHIVTADNAILTEASLTGKV